MGSKYKSVMTQFFSNFAGNCTSLRGFAFAGDKPLNKQGQQNNKQAGEGQMIHVC